MLVRRPWLNCRTSTSKTALGQFNAFVGGENALPVGVQIVGGVEHFLADLLAALLLGGELLQAGQQ